VHDAALPVGLGRSYGDVGLLKDGTLLQTTGMDRLLAFDAETGVRRPSPASRWRRYWTSRVRRGFFLPVTPGTKYVTLGGAIANAFMARTMSTPVPSAAMCRALNWCGRMGRAWCARAQRIRTGTAATIGGMGLTGLIAWAELRLKPIVSRAMDCDHIQFRGIDEWLTLKQQYAAAEYNVSWIDCVSTGRNFARGIFMAGDHAKASGEAEAIARAEAGISHGCAGVCAESPLRRSLQRALLS